MAGATRGLDLRAEDPADAHTAPAHIRRLLTRAFEQRSLLTVHVGDDRRAYTSAILEVAADEHYLVLDELVPGSGHERLASERGIRVRALVDGVDLSFASHVSEIGVDGGLPFYKVPFPSRVHHAQRRRVHRVTVPLARAAPAMLMLPDERELVCELKDLSPGGLCLRLPERFSEPRPERGSLALCRLQPPRRPVLLADVEICHVDVAVEGRVGRLGGRFVNLAPGTRRGIEQYCAELERQQLRAT